MGKKKDFVSPVLHGNDPLLLFAEQIMTGRALENAEERNQKELVKSDVLPVKGSENPAWGKMGVTFGDVVPDNEVLRYATLPKGWKKVPSDHPMHSTLVDEKGRTRASISYKAAIYDRYASMYLIRRYTVKAEQAPGLPKFHENAKYFGVVLDCGKEIWRSAEAFEKIGAPPDWDNDHHADDRAEKAGCAWLDEHFPDHHDASAYWD